MRRVALFGAAVSFTLATLASAGCYRCDSPGHPRCPDVTPSYPEPVSAQRDAGRE